MTQAQDNSRSEETTAHAWEERYAGNDRVWSGKVNAVLEEIASNLKPGIALDVGSGEGADVVWLANRGWSAVGIDVSPTAVRRGQEAARVHGLSPREADFKASDLTDLGAVLGDQQFDLVSASYLQSPAVLERDEIVSRVAARVADGGLLLLTSHASAPSWSSGSKHDHHGPRIYPQPQEEVSTVRASVPEASWEVLEAAVRERLVSGPDGEPATLEDTVVLMRRKA